MKNILVVIPVKDSHKAKLEAAGAGCEFTYSSPSTVTEEEIAGADIVIGNVPAKLINASTRLSLYQLNSAGADPYIVPGVLAENTILTNATGAYSKSVAEHCFGCLLMLQKKLHLYRDQQFSGSWDDLGSITSLSDMRVLVIGLGDIGEHFAMLCKNMGSTVIGIKRRPGGEPKYVDEIRLTDAVMEELPKADVVFSILPGTEATHHFFTKEHFRAMKETAIFINAGRGTAVESEVLEWALKDGQIGSAAIDVTDPEPLPPDSPLWKIPNLLITPHIAGKYHLAETFEIIVDIACENIKAHLNGGTLRNVVDFNTGYKK